MRTSADGGPADAHPWGGSAACCVVPLAAYSSISLLFLVYPLIIWAAPRFQVAGGMLCALLTSVLATVAATDRVGAFDGLSRIEVMAKLQEQPARHRRPG
ncbi:MASE1 domain-containing protein [Streptomyces sp. NPDC007905]|uniref:MASE1 domain-containing protein n=1 Tax=Streptomyces sp. NPDC007905 TaxID=3364788 RepID=UPI0036EC1883